MSPTRITLARPDGDLHALALGAHAAPLVVVLHGFPDDPRNFLPVADRLAAAGYRVVVAWSRGYFPSTLRGPFFPERLALDACAWIEAFSPDRSASVVGHDWGAVVTHHLLARHRGRVRAAVTMSVPHLISMERALRRDAAQQRRSAYMTIFQLGRIADAVVRADDYAFIDRLWAAWSPGTRYDASAVQRAKETLGRSGSAPIDFYRDIRRPTLAALARWREYVRMSRALSTPTLHLAGADDACVDPNLGRDAARYYDAPFRHDLVPRCGHFLHVEQPDDVATRIIGWLERHDPRPVA